MRDVYESRQEIIMFSGIQRTSKNHPGCFVNPTWDPELEYSLAHACIAMWLESRPFIPNHGTRRTDSGWTVRRPIMGDQQRSTTGAPFVHVVGTYQHDRL